MTAFEKTSIGSGIMMPNIPQEIGLRRLSVGGTGTLPNSSFIVYTNDTSTGATTGITIEQGGTGDAALHFLNTSQDQYMLGIDNSASNIFTMNQGPTSSTSGLVIDTSNRFGIGSAPDTSGKLTIASTSTSFIPPRMTSAQQVAISTPTAGSIVYNSTSGSLMLYNGSVWQTITAA